MSKTETKVLYSGFETLKEALDAHKKWLLGEDGGRGANLSDADLRGADLSDADLRGADLMNGLTWEQYLSDVVPALCTAGGKTLEAVAAGWDCHDWSNCPMHIAFDAPSLEDVPPLYRREAELFITFFDAKLVPNPIAAVSP